METKTKGGGLGFDFLWKQDSKGSFGIFSFKDERIEVDRTLNTCF